LPLCYFRIRPISHSIKMIRSPNRFVFGSIISLWGRLTTRGN
jgi:hypothetical protein